MHKHRSRKKGRRVLRTNYSRTEPADGCSGAALSRLERTFPPGNLFLSSFQALDLAAMTGDDAFRDSRPARGLVLLEGSDRAPGPEASPELVREQVPKPEPALFDLTDTDL